LVHFIIGFAYTKAELQDVPGKNQPVRVSPLSAVESYRMLRDQLQHEDNLITQRLSWLMGSVIFVWKLAVESRVAESGIPLSGEASAKFWLTVANSNRRTLAPVPLSSVMAAGRTTIR
jgi:hypothetical protein